MVIMCVCVCRVVNYGELKWNEKKILGPIINNFFSILPPAKNYTLFISNDTHTPTFIYVMRVCVFNNLSLSLSLSKFTSSQFFNDDDDDVCLPFIFISKNIHILASKKNFWFQFQDRFVFSSLFFYSNIITITHVKMMMMMMKIGLNESHTHTHHDCIKKFWFWFYFFRSFLIFKKAIHSFT